MSTANETWNTCPDCGTEWKDEKPTPQVMHRTRLCEKCKTPDKRSDTTLRADARGALREAGWPDDLVLKAVPEQPDAFKDFVHRRLDTAGVPKEFTNGKHTKEGCRIGDRLDWVLDRPDVAKLAAACELALLWHAGRWTDRERAKWDEHMAVIMAQPQVPDGVWQGVAATAKNLCDAIRAALAAVNVNWRAPIPELEGSFPLVLYFANEADRDEAIAVVKADRPNMKAVPL